MQPYQVIWSCLKPFVSYGILWSSMEFWTNLEIPFYWNHDFMPSTIFLVIQFSFIVALDQHITSDYTHIYLISGQFLWKPHQKIAYITQLPHVSRCGEVRPLPEKAKTWSPQSIGNLPNHHVDFRFLGFWNGIKFSTPWSFHHERQFSEAKTWWAQSLEWVEALGPRPCRRIPWLRGQKDGQMGPFGW